VYCAIWKVKSIESQSGSRVVRISLPRHHLQVLTRRNVDYAMFEVKSTESQSGSLVVKKMSNFVTCLLRTHVKGTSE